MDLNLYLVFLLKKKNKIQDTAMKNYLDTINKYTYL